MLNAEAFFPGDRVKLIAMSDPYRDDVPIGVEGTVLSVAPPPINVVNVEWDDGFSLNPCLDEDIIVKV